MLVSPARQVWFVLRSWPAQALLIAVVIWAQTLSPKVLLLTFAGLAVWALRGPRQAIQSLSLVWMLGLLNPDLLAAEVRAVWPRDSTLLLLKWMVLAAAAARCMLETLVRRESVPRPIFWLTLFCLSTGLASVATSGLPGISAAKLVAFWVGATTVILGFQHSAGYAREHRDWFTALATALVVLSVPLLFVPVMYRYHDHLFRGLLMHPQYTALVFATIFAWMAGRCLTERHLAVGPLVAAIGALSVLWPTGSRTAVFAALLALGAALLIRLLVTRPSLRQCVSALARPRIAAAGFLVVVTAVASEGAMGESVSRFIQKRDPGTVLGASSELWSTREHMVRLQWHNFTQRPLFGNGFGVPSDLGEARIVQDPLTGFALSAPTEKGFLPTAVLEEAGVVGAVLLAAALVSLLMHVARASHFPRAWMAATALFVNFGESVFFSFGGVGMFLWLMVGYATAPEPPVEGPEYP